MQASARCRRDRRAFGRTDLLRRTHAAHQAAQEVVRTSTERRLRALKECRLLQTSSEEEEEVEEITGTVAVMMLCISSKNSRKQNRLVLKIDEEDAM